MRVVQKKICMLGDFAVGKTSLVRRFVEGRFNDKYLSTIGVKISRKPIPRTDYTLNLLLWDLAGGDNFVNAPSNYLIGVTGAILVCDLTRHSTLRAYDRYVDQIKQFNEAAPILFLANKVDLIEERSITDDDLEKAIEPFNGTYFLTSAKTGEQVEEAFLFLADQLGL